MLKFENTAVLIAPSQRNVYVFYKFHSINVFLGYRGIFGHNDADVKFIFIDSHRQRTCYISQTSGFSKGTASEEASKTRIILLTAFNKGFYIEESSIYLYN